MSETIFHLSPEMFQPQNRCLVESGSLSAETFQFSSGVPALTLHNDLGQLVLLPYQGQQIWSATLAGRELTMKTMFTQPIPTRDFLSTFGGFLVHCGGAARGIPGQQGIRLLHGEFPNAPYQSAGLLIGEDEKGAYIGLTGSYPYTVAFYDNFIARPTVKLYAGATIFGVEMEVVNLKQTAMELSYLAHINFRPVDGGRLVYSAICSPEHMRVNTELPAHLEPKPGYTDFVDDLARHPEKHLIFHSNQKYDPEVVIRIDYLADENGWSRQMQVHPDGTADVVRHRPNELGRGIRWISRTPDQDAIGFEPATGLEGHNFITITGGASFHCKMDVGVLSATEALAEEQLTKPRRG
jgi:hypothetical protein